MLAPTSLLGRLYPRLPGGLARGGCESWLLRYSWSCTESDSLPDIVLHGEVEGPPSQSLHHVNLHVSHAPRYFVNIVMHVYGFITSSVNLCF